MKQIEQTRKNR
ncbi:unnamed protein product [Acanthoscelides obtectus]|uniref:Uncharacterized protein n=1 Tax=Acanthoscelides obtectus TaxID=200917 RepID=A0A9P0PTD4_ACAOB|nr:unnamed protein product [Acanthoscelides obtectus]